MAGPHVVGVVALLWQAVPSLNRDIAATKARLNGTANPNITPNSNCGPAPPAPPIPNNNFGHGLVDALAAVQGGGPPPPPPPPPPGAWTNVAPLPQSVGGATAANDGTFFVFFGDNNFADHQDRRCTTPPLQQHGHQQHAAGGYSAQGAVRLLRLLPADDEKNHLLRRPAHKTPAQISSTATPRYTTSSQTRRRGAPTPAPQPQSAPPRPRQPEESP